MFVRLTGRPLRQIVTNLWLPTCSSIIGILVFLCLLSLFVPDNEFLACFSPVENLKILYDMRSVSADHQTFDSSEQPLQNAFLHGMKAMLAIASIGTHLFIYCGQFFAHGYGSVKEQEIPWYLQSFIKRFLPFAQSLYFLGGFLSMYAW